MEFIVKTKWHSADEEPANEPIVYVSENQRFGTLKTTVKWSRYVEKYNIKYWATQDDLNTTIEYALFKNKSSN